MEIKHYVPAGSLMTYDEETAPAELQVTNVEKHYVPAGSLLTCDKGTTPAELKVTFNARTSIYGENLATDLDKVPVVNVPPMGICAVTKGPCVVVPVAWSPVKQDVRLGGQAFLLLEDSKLRCGVGGCVSIQIPPAEEGMSLEKSTDKGEEKSSIQKVLNQTDARLKKIQEQGGVVGFLFGGTGRVGLGIAEGVGEAAVETLHGFWDLSWDLFGLAKKAVAHPFRAARALKRKVTNTINEVLDPGYWDDLEQSLLNGINNTVAKMKDPERTQIMNELMKTSPRDWGKVMGKFGFEVGLAAVTDGATAVVVKAAKTNRVVSGTVRLVEEIKDKKLKRPGGGKGPVGTGKKKPTTKPVKKVRSPVCRPGNVRKSKLICVGDPVDVAMGIMLFDQVDLALPGPIPFAWARTWYSNSEYNGPLGHGWHHAYDLALAVEDDGSLDLRLADGRLALFEALTAANGYCAFHRGERLEARRQDGGYRVFDVAGRLTYCFAPAPTLAPDTASTGAHVLAAIENASGFTIRFVYDEHGRLHTIWDSAGRELRLRLDAQGRVAALEAPLPEGPGRFAAVEYAYDGAGNMTAATDALGQAMRHDYRGHLLVRKQLRGGTSFYFEYDGDGPAAKCVRTWGDGDVLNKRLAYGPGQTTVRSLAAGEVDVYYHEDGLVTAHVDPLGAVRQWIHGAEGDLVLERDPLGRAAGYDYDARGNLTDVAHPDGAKVSMQFNGQDLPTAGTDANGGAWQWQYDTQGRLLGAVDPTGATTRRTYDAQGRLSSVTDALGHAIRLRYDAQGNLAHVVDAAGNIRSREYDALGRLVAATDAVGNRQRRRYDLLGQLVEVLAADGTATRLAYDAAGNVSRADDGVQQVDFAYTALGQLARRQQAGQAVHFAYDLEGRLTGLVNEHDEAYRFVLDAAGQVVEEVGFDGLTRRYERDAAGRVVHITRPAGRTTAYTYDAAGRVAEVLHNQTERTRYRYRADGALLEAATAADTVEFERDPLGRVVREVQKGHAVVSAYDALGQRRGLTSSLGANFTFERDALGQVRQMHAGTWQSRVGRDAEGLELHRQLSGGLQTGWQRDARGRPTSQRVTAAGGGTVRQRRYQWQGADQLLEVEDSLHGPTKFAYDAGGGLAAATYADGSQELRQPDAVGNLFRTASRTDRRYGKGGQLREASGTRYQYDEEGNLARKTTPDGNAWRYAWDGTGQLTGVTRPDGYTVTFAYDALGRRISKRFRGRVTKWVWDGDVPLHEWTELEVGPGAGGIQDLATWLFEEDSFSPAAKLTAQGAQSVVCDHLGTPLTMYDGQGRPTWEMALDSYGGVRQGKGKAQDCPFRYQGQYEDVETGLYYNRFRYYDPEVGQYISQDPIGLMGGQKLYAYVYNPNRLIDPLGLAPWKNGEFEKWFDSATPAEVLANKQSVSAALRGSGGKHEMFPVSMAAKAKELNFTYAELMGLTKVTTEIEFKNVLDKDGNVLNGPHSTGAKLPDGQSSRASSYFHKNLMTELDGATTKDQALEIINRLHNTHC